MTNFFINPDFFLVIYSSIIFFNPIFSFSIFNFYVLTIFRFAYMRANTGYAGSSSVTRVILSTIKYSEYSTGIVRDITNIYSAAQCSTTAYQSVASYLRSKNTCLFSKIIIYVNPKKYTSRAIIDENSFFISKETFFSA